MGYNPTVVSLIFLLEFSHWELFRMGPKHWQHAATYICAYFSLCLFLHCKMLQAHWYAQLQSQSRQYSRGPGFSYWRPVSETKVWVLGPVFYVRHIPHPTNPDGHWMCSCLFDTLSSLTPKSTGAYQQHFLLECSSPPSSG